MGSLKDLPPELLKEWFPQLIEGSYLVTSPASEDYNCIAWSLGDSTRKWDPSPIEGRYWPANLGRRYDVHSFTELYGAVGGFAPCENGDLEAGVEKIALYVGLDNEVKHAALQLPSGMWTSKLGDFEDIQHALEVLEGGGYGFVKQFFKRGRRGDRAPTT
jgi:hypothetical protein